MKFARLTIQYLRKAWPFLILVHLPVAVVLGIFTRPLSTLTFLPDYFFAAEPNAGFFWSVFSREALTRIYPVVMIAIFLPIGICLSFGWIEKHFRVGKRNVKGAFKQINEYILSVAVTLLILTLLISLYSLVQIGMLSLLSFLLGGSNMAMSVVAAVTMQALAVVLFVLMVFLCLFVLFVPQSMTLFGYSFRDSFTSSLRLVGKNAVGLAVGIVLPLLLVALVENGVVLLPVPYFVKAIIESILYLFIIVYLVTYVMVAFFDLTGMERRDLSVRLPKIKWK